MIGIATVASPDDDGIRNDSGRNSKYIRLMNATPPRPPTACSAALSTVSVISPLFMITVMPRAMPMISATPSRSRAPSTNVVVKSASPIRADDPDEDREEQERRRHLGEPPPQGGHRRDAEVLPRDDPEDHDHEREEEQDEHAPSGARSSRRCPSRTPLRRSRNRGLVVGRLGGRRATSSGRPGPSRRSASRRRSPMAVPTTRMTSRPTMPSSIETPANSEAMPVANGLIVEPSTPMPQPRSSDRRADQRVVAGRDHDRDDQRRRTRGSPRPSRTSCRRWRRRSSGSGSSAARGP